LTHFDCEEAKAAREGEKEWKALKDRGGKLKCIHAETKSYYRAKVL
jgi:hypothetical protein